MFHRQYAIATGPPALPLDEKLLKLENSAHKNQFVSKKDVNDLLRAFKKEKPSLQQYLRAFKFFGMSVRPRVGNQNIRSIVFDSIKYNIMIFFYF